MKEDKKPDGDIVGLARPTVFDRLVELLDPDFVTTPLSVTYKEVDIFPANLDELTILNLFEYDIVYVERKNLPRLGR